MLSGSKKGWQPVDMQTKASNWAKGTRYSFMKATEFSLYTRNGSTVDY